MTALVIPNAIGIVTKKEKVCLDVFATLTSVHLCLSHLPRLNVRCPHEHLAHSSPWSSNDGYNDIYHEWYISTTVDPGN